MKYEKTFVVTQHDLKQRQWRVMTPQDQMGFAGVESPVPLISECDKFLAVLDGLHLEVYGTDEASGDFEPIFSIDDVRKLV
jgi:hypothetical protein